MERSNHHRSERKCHVRAGARVWNGVATTAVRGRVTFDRYGRHVHGPSASEQLNVLTRASRSRARLLTTSPSVWCLVARYTLAVHQTHTRQCLSQCRHASTGAMPSRLVPGCCIASRGGMWVVTSPCSTHHVSLLYGCYVWGNGVIYRSGGVAVPNQFATKMFTCWRVPRTTRNIMHCSARAYRRTHQCRCCQLLQSWAWQRVLRLQRGGETCLTRATAVVRLAIQRRLRGRCLAYSRSYQRVHGVANAILMFNLQDFLGSASPSSDGHGMPR